jgi:hypothetical protein
VTDTVQRIRLVVSCPGDVEADIECIRRAVQEINESWGESRGFVIVVSHWKTAAVPDVSTSPQQAINEQLFETFDIYVGLMGSKFGTPTGKAGSGTEEEFKLAHSMWKSGKKVGILFYFRSTADLLSIDLTQVALVRQFRDEIGKDGVLWATYDSQASLEQAIRKHLPRHIQRICGP